MTKQQSLDKLQSDIEALSFVSGRNEHSKNNNTIGLGRLVTREYDIDDVIKEAEDEMLEEDASRLGRQSIANSQAADK